MRDARPAGDGRHVMTFDDADGFDAVVGRLVLMHLADRASALRRVATLVRPGGVLALADSSSCRSSRRRRRARYSAKRSLG